MRNLVTVVAFGICAAGSAVALADAASVVNSRSSTSVTNSVDSSTSSSVRNSVRSNNSVITNNSVNSNSATNSSIVANDGATVSNSTITDVGGTSTTTNSIVGRTGSMCSAVVEGKRCDIQCRAPQVAQCGKSADLSEPSCLCQ